MANTKETAGHCELIAHGSDDYWQVVTLRSELLRQPQGLSFSDNELQREVDSHHLVYRIGGEIAACVVLKPVSNHRVKLRQMAVAEQWQGQGVGRRLIQGAECWLVEQGYREVELNARTSAEGFYAGLGYRATGEPFMEVGLPHRVMGKVLR